MASDEKRVKRRLSESPAVDTIAASDRSDRSGANAKAIAQGIIEVARQLTLGGTPAPKGSPFFGLDHDMPYEASALRLLSSQGIFRKYELVLEVGSGLGGRARWAAEMFGCQVVAVEVNRDKASIAEALNRASRTQGVWVTCGASAHIPLRSGAVTHAWWLAGQEGNAAQRVLREVWRVLRDGGFFALILPAATTEAAAVWSEDLGEAGFERPETRLWSVEHRGELHRVAERRFAEYATRQGWAPASWCGLLGTVAREPTQLLALFTRRRPLVRRVAAA